MKRNFLFNVAVLSLFILLGITTGSRAQTTTFSYTGAVQTYTVPAGLTSVIVDMEGGNGGTSYYGSPGGKGGRVQTTLAVTPGQVLQLYVGGRGGNNTTTSCILIAGGFNGGASNGTKYYSAGAGGASDIRTTAGDLTTRLVVAGGGGGGGYDCSTTNNGGDGGGLTGAAGLDCGTPSTCYSGYGGAQTLTANGPGCYSTTAYAGSLGNGGVYTSSCSYGSGGGGGYYGGGGGGYYGSGGGGSSYTSASLCTGTTHSQGYNTDASFTSGNGTIIIIGPTVTPTPTSLAFGSITSGSTSASMVFGLSGVVLTAGGSLTITPPANFEISPDGTTWYTSASPYTYTYSGSGFTGTTFFARFKPTAVASYSGNIVITGGGLVAPVSIAVTGAGATACSGVPTAGTATINGGTTASGNSSTVFTLNSTGATAAGGITYQWQQSSTGAAGSFTNIPGANSVPYSYTGLAANTFFQLVVTCPTYSSVTTGTVSATFTLPASSCIPTSISSPCTYYVGTSGNPVIITGAGSTSISDASPCGSGTGGSAYYYNNVSTYSVTFNQNSTYSATIGSGYYYTTGQIWIDFNDDGVFNNTTEVVGGYSNLTCCSIGARNVVSIVIPAGAAPGVHRMRVMNGYNGGNGPGGSPSYPDYPLMNPCPASPVQYADTRDYKVIINTPPAVVTVAPAAVAFGNVTVGTSSVPVGFSTITASNLLPTAGYLTIAAPTGFQVSTNGTSWANSLSLAYIGGTIAPTNIYVQFNPTSTSSYSDVVAITGGGLSAAVNIAVTGAGVTTGCSGAPTAGTAVITPTSGSSVTNFTLSLTGASTTGGLLYQWQSSIDGGTTWTNIAAAIYPTYSFTGLFANTQFRAIVTCGTGASATSTVASATVAAGSLAASSCTPTFSYVYDACYSYGMTFRFSNFTGSAGAITDGTGCSTATAYTDLTASQICTVNASTSYTATLATGGGAYGNYSSSLACQVWIDFNNDGIFTTSESVGGFVTGTLASGATSGTVTVAIPAGVPTGRYRMRLEAMYNSPNYPSLPPCPTTANNYGSVRDYSVFVNGGAPPCSGTPVAGIVSTLNSTNCSAFKADLFSVGQTSNPGITYAWQSSTSATTGFTAISGATNAMYQTPTISAVGTTYYRNLISCGTSSVTTTPVAVTLSAPPDISNFTAPAATTSCLGSASTVTVNSTTLAAGGSAYTVTYSLSGANTSTGNTASLTMGSTSGTFAIPSSALTAAGATTVTITAITSVVSGCSSNPSTSNTASFTVSSPDVSNFTATSAATPTCLSAGEVVTISSTSLGTSSAFTALYNLSGAATSTGNTGALTMTSTNGTFTIPSSLLAVGTMTVTVTGIRNAAGCTSAVTSNNTSAFTINASAPIATVTGGGSYCVGGAGINVGLSSSGSSVINYALYRGATLVTTVNGTGAAISFGLQSVVGTYSVVATHTGTGCITNMAGAVNVNVTAVPTAYNVGGGGSYCSGGSGVVLTLSGSDAGASYQVYNGATAVGSLITGTGVPISLGTQTASGTYIAIANPGAGAGCQLNMNGSATVVINPLPTAYSVSGGGNYCAGSTATPICLSFTNSGIQYTLYNGASPVTVLSGTGSAACFTAVGTAGTYTVQGMNTATGCVNAMTGSATIGINALPGSFTSTGGGTLCSGGAGVSVGLSGSATGINYQLYNGSSMTGSSIAGTGSALSFGAQTTAGVYTVLATNATTSCTAAMTGSSTVIVNPTPTQYTVNGGGAYCSGGTGVTVGLNGSTAGVNYTLYNGTASVGTAVSGTGAAISFGTFTAAGTYTVAAVNASTACAAGMLGNAVISINAVPTAYAISGGGGYCNGGTGVAIGVTGTQTGVNYTLMLGTTPVTTLTGTGSSISFGNFTTAGTYIVNGVNTVTGCTTTMSGSAVVVVNPLPTAYSVTGGGNYCSGGTGVPVGLSGSATGVNYTLYNGATAVGTAVAGTGTPISLGVQTTSATYTVFAVNPTTTCSSSMTGSATVGINPLPTAYGVTGGGAYCAGTGGTPVGLGASTAGVNYQLYNGSLPVGGPIAGTGGAISFGSMTTAATYTVQGTNATTSCTNAMAGNAVVSINAVPTVFAVTSSGTNYCAGGAGITIGVSGSQSGINYQLYNGSTASGTAVAGTGGAVSFGSRTATGTYTVQAVNASTSCVSNMSSSATVNINPTPTVYAVTGGGSYCNGGTGVNIGVNGSQIGINYQLYNGAGAVGSAAAGTGAAISFGPQTAAGTYTVLGTTTATGCTANMAASAVVSINAVPAVQSVTGGGVYCAGGNGVTIGLGGSVSGTTYQLYNGATAGMSVSGTGSSVSFGLQTATGTYSVLATNGAGCTTAMTGTATISTNPTPTVYTVAGGGNYCSGGTGVSITLGGSQTGISYQLYNSGLTSGSALSGTGGGLTFTGVTAGGSYNIIATNSATLCTSNMGGTATVGVNPLPTQYTVSGGGSYCNGGSGVDIALSGSNAGIAYQLYNGTLAVGSLVAGSGLPIDFGLKTGAGNYTVVAINTSTSCTNNMLGSPAIVINALPTAYTVTGGGSYCNGGAGVNVGLNNSSTGVSYQLYNGAGSAGTSIIGTGSAIDFGAFTAAGTYTVQATNTSTSCVNNMAGSAVVSISPLPTLFNVSGGGTTCNGSAGVNVNLNGSTSGVSYQLLYMGAPVGTAVIGTGSAITFGPQNGNGNYTAIATNSTTSCQRTMAGSANVVVNALPTAYPVTGGGASCSGDGGVAVGLGNSTAGINYTLYNGTASVTTVSGTGGAISFGLQSAAGTNYNVIATNSATTCTNNMTGSVAVTVGTLPTAYTLTGGGNLCAGSAGVNITLSGSNTGVSYQLMNGASNVGTAINGTGGPISFGPQTAGGTYAVMATNNTSSCTNFMTGNPVVNVNAVPTAYVISGGGSYCNGDAGVAVGLGGSATGINYQLYNNSVATGSPVAGTGNAISFGMQTGAGNYTVIAMNASTSCTNNMSGTATVSVNALPANYAVTGGGSLCAGSAGVTISMGNSTSGIQYQLYNGSTAVGSAVLGAGGAFDFGTFTTAGTYSVIATNPATTCSRNMTGSATVIVNTLPVAQTFTGGGSYCNGGTGVAMSLGSSATGVTYQLYNGSSAVGSSMAGTGSGINFGLQTAAGTYSVLATNTATGCTNGMSGTTTVVVNGLPNAYAVLSLGSSYCAGGEGVHVLLSGSDAGVDYQLYNGSTAVGSPYAGTGSELDFGSLTAAGIYRVVANNGATTCSSNMTGAAAISINPLPTAYAITGGGNYCSGTAGSMIGLANSTSGISYQLYRNGTPTGAAVAGVTGSPISFGPQTGLGTYMVMATNNVTACTMNMTGTVAVAINAVPATYTVNGGGTYCNGGTGVAIGLLGSSTTATYQLYNAGVATGSPVSGTGGAISFGPQTIAGTYSVIATNATTGCTGNMTGSASVIVNALPAAYAVTGSGNYCTGSTGLTVGLANSATGVSYQLYNGGTAVGAAVAGNTGSAISFGAQPAGSYNIIATSSVTGCTNTMTGAANVVANALPTAVAVTGGGNYCATASSTGLPVGLASSATGVNYQLYRGATAVGSVVAGNGSAISFGNQTAAGIYTVAATNATTSCTNTMSGSATIAVNPAVVPSVSVVSSAGSTACLGVLVTYSASSVNGGTTPAYQWMVNGVNVGLGLSNYSYVPGNGDVVSVALTSSESCASPAIATNAITMAVTSSQMPEAKVTVSPSDTVCQGTTVSYNVTPIFGGANPTYIWMKNGVQVATGTTYSTVPLNNDVISVKMTSDFPCRLADDVTTDNKMVVVNPTTPEVTITANPGTYVSAGRHVTLTAHVTNAGNAPTYQWYNGFAPIFGATTATFTSSNFENNDSITCVVMTTGPCAMHEGFGSVVMKVATTGVVSVASSKSDLRLLPNPNKGDFIVRGTIGTTDDQELNVEVTDMLGQVVYKGKMMAHNGNVDEKIKISNTLANGMYLLNLRSDNENKTFHFIIEQ